MTDQSGAFPETLREAPGNDQLLLLEMNLARLTDELNRIPELQREDELQLAKASLDMVRGWRAALERPRPAPPEPQELHVYESEPTNPGYEGKVTVKKFSELRNAMSPERQQRAHERAEEILTDIRGGTAGTGAAQ